MLNRPTPAADTGGPSARSRTLVCYGLLAALDRMLRDGELRRSMSSAAPEHTARFTWAATARGALEVLAADAIRRRGRP
jgi:hypothetical protein